jgi:hypothetical protein
VSTFVRQLVGGVRRLDKRLSRRSGTAAHTEIRYGLPMHGILIVLAGAAVQIRR